MLPHAHTHIRMEPPRLLRTRRSSAMMLPAMLVGMEGDQVWQYGNRTIKELMNGPYMPSAPGTTALAGHDRERHTRLRDGLHSTSGESPVRAVTEAVALTSYGAT